MNDMCLYICSDTFSVALLYIATVTHVKIMYQNKSITVVIDHCPQSVLGYISLAQDNN